MVVWTGIELNEIFGTTLDPKLEITGVSIDSRTIQAGDLFVALQGVSQDGHLFVEQAVQNGAAVVLVSKEIAGLNCPQIVVFDTLRALREMAEFARMRSLATIIAITGSVGKTSTKEILAHVLEVFGDVSFSAASFNNHWGVPLSLARLPKEAKFGVFEVGMNHAGEIAPLAALIKPHISVITSIVPAHIGNMGSMQAIATEKAAIYSGLVAGGTAIIPCDTEFYTFLSSVAAEYSPKQILGFGESDAADVRLLNYRSNECGGMVDISIEGEELQYIFPLRGRHFAVNSLSVISVAISLNLDVNEVCARLETMPAIKNRGEIYELEIDGKKVTLIDDAYNANLVSMKAGIDVLMEYSWSHRGRRIAVLGEMLELGNYATPHHKELGRYLEAHEVDLVYLTGGEAMQQCLVVLPEVKQHVCVRNPLDLVPSLRRDLQNGDVILVKGSKGSRVSLVVDELLKAASIKNKIYAC
ncbi:UDP-N-acetylmuramoyl-tripeptide--D-alanyl-D-alanine ligase [Candidatus Paracaedibacter symbiosus]|uniref:UDP-N-acetylmuramoyl-tripeptide--D-alanyl-D- alanine ligase n=1 Tax=Candidatus Paracaedibacter symbiosus TaxID=244582 RepID=UPI000AEB6FD1|nr:UDP-N-acetylmuramoyl-tripeptide--D-alanyl-D-alanine ligase [Candidatus Paracaedibacter symbiosus]